MILRILPVVSMLACGGSPESTDIPESAATSEAAPSAAQEPATVRAQAPAPTETTEIKPAVGGKGPPLVLVWNGISALHKSFFSTQDVVTRLAGALQGTIQPPANVHIRFDSKRHKGWIQLQLRPETLRLSVGGEGDLVRLQDLAPITTALATYRSTVAGRYDVRVESFHVGIESYRGPVRCVFGVGGLKPPDGKTVSSCVEINSTRHCGTEEADGVRFTTEVADKIRDCLR
jgi:hypothetical protein